ncbi:MAG: hypothetical protein AB7Q81_02670 [Gammaproteobacteria bacterium]
MGWPGDYSTRGRAPSGPSSTGKSKQCTGARRARARGAAECCREVTAVRADADSGAADAPRPATSVRIGRALANADAVDDLLRSAAGRVLAWDGTGELGWARAVLVIKPATDGVTDVANGDAFRTEAPLQCYFRNVNAPRRHAAFDHEGTMEV